MIAGRRGASLLVRTSRGDYRVDPQLGGDGRAVPFELRGEFPSLEAAMRAADAWDFTVGYARQWLSAVPGDEWAGDVAARDDAYRLALSKAGVLTLHRDVLDLEASAMVKSNYEAAEGGRVSGGRSD